ncbi:SufE family protein [Thalassococcus sp. CAU 1522]|uniref:SufE family protein n=1 Tax=Thalassococcus arenae TaxID=2851652 RepID=A0ABS6NAE0_9RHOB|nr:SufE family protein [Thalassococcus arenae]MBV2360996.1 SufE family protein [Thalassococcus arenae]
MAQARFEEVVEDFEFLEDWEDRYRMVIEMGKAMPPMPDALKVPATKVEGCASQVWLHMHPQDGAFHFQGDSDAMIVRGLIALLHRLYDGLPLTQVPAVDARAELGRLGLHDHLSAQRSNGLRAMIERIRNEARAVAG